MNYNYRPPYENELYHYGVMGMKWGVRRYQNPDGTLTNAGKRRYGVNDLPNRSSVSQQALYRKLRSEANAKERIKNASSKEEKIQAKNDLKRVKDDIKELSKSARALQKADSDAVGNIRKVAVTTSENSKKQNYIKGKWNTTTSAQFKTQRQAVDYLNAKFYNSHGDEITYDALINAMDYDTAKRGNRAAAIINTAEVATLIGMFGYVLVSSIK